MSPLEKCARAIHADWMENFDHGIAPADKAPWESLSEKQKAFGLGQARACLEAIREPDDGMVSAFWASPANNGPDDAPGVPVQGYGGPTASEWFGTRAEFDAAVAAMIDHVISQ